MMRVQDALARLPGGAACRVDDGTDRRGGSLSSRRAGYIMESPIRYLTSRPGERREALQEMLGET